MKPTVLVAALVCLLAAGGATAHPKTSAAPATAPSPDQALAAPAAVLDAFHAALARGDGPGAAATLDEAVLIYEEGWVDADKAAYVAGHLPEDLVFLKDMTETRSNRTGGVSGDLAWIASTGRMQGTHDGKVVDRETAETVILRRTGGVWRIVQIHWSSHARKAA